MFSSGGTANNVASWIKEKGAKYVEGWFSHIVTAKEQIKKALKADSIDKIVALNTVIQDPRLKAVHIEVSEHLLAAELYKAHENFLTDRIA
jgi:phosphoribosylpyrophosphate synthetase